MTPYWALFGLFAFAALAGGARLRFAEREGSYANTETKSALLAMGAVLVALMIGVRFEVGGDWYAYASMYQLAFYKSLLEMLSLGDPAYQLLTWSSQQLGGGLVLINLTCGAIFSWGLYRLVRIQPEPWLALLAAVPYLIVVVAMGYTRQAVALGILMAGIAKLMRGAHPLSFIAYVVVAGLFHKTAVFLLPLCILFVYKRKVITVMIAAISGFFIFLTLLAGSLDDLIRQYVDVRYSSQGAMLRLIMTALAAVLFIALRKRLQFNEVEEKIWRNFALASFALLLCLVVVPSSTVVDRVGLYLLPLQFVTLSRIPVAMREEFVSRLVVIAYSAMTLFGWLNYAQNATYWIPYRVSPL